MFEEKINELYRKIAQQISDMIPVDWQEIYFEGEVLEGAGGTYFYFNTPKNEEQYTYSLLIPEEYGVDEAVFDRLDYKLFELTKELQEVFIENHQEPWFSVIFYLNSNGNFEIKYNYVNWFDGGFVPSQIIKYFKYKYLGIIPNKEIDKETMKKMDSFAENNN